MPFEFSEMNGNACRSKYGNCELNNNITALLDRFWANRSVGSIPRQTYRSPVFISRTKLSRQPCKNKWMFKCESCSWSSPQNFSTFCIDAVRMIDSKNSYYSNGNAKSIKWTLNLRCINSVLWSPDKYGNSNKPKTNTQTKNNKNVKAITIFYSINKLIYWGNIL